MHGERNKKQQWLKMQTAVRQQPVRPGEGFIPETGSKALSEEHTAKGCAEIWRYHRCPTRLSGPLSSSLSLYHVGPHGVGNSTAVWHHLEGPRVRMTMGNKQSSGIYGLMELRSSWYRISNRYQATAATATAVTSSVTCKLRLIDQNSLKLNMTEADRAFFKKKKKSQFPHSISSKKGRQY